MKARLRAALILVGILAAVGAAYVLGYRAGLKDKGPQHRALVVVRRTPGNPNSTGQSYTWYDISWPSDAARLKADDARLTAQGVEHYVEEGVIQTTLGTRPNPSRVNSHR